MAVHFVVHCYRIFIRKILEKEHFLMRSSVSVTKGLLRIKSSFNSLQCPMVWG